MQKTKFELIYEGAGSCGCVLVRFPLRSTVEIQEWINKNIPSDMVLTPEHESHVTVLYGVKPNVDPSVIEEYFKSVPSIVIKLKSIGLFKNGIEDVVKVDVESPQLHRIHKELRKVIGEENIQPSEFDYNPHLTLAFVVAGTCDELEGNDRFNGYVYVLNEVTYSTPGSKRKIDFTLTN